MNENNTPIRSFDDLEIYKLFYKLSLSIAQNIIPKIPLNDPYNFRSQLGRSSSACPRLIAEGYGKRHQKLGFQKYLDDTHAESNESQVSLCQIRDFYPNLIDKTLLDELINNYNVLSRQIFSLRKTWKTF